jgi:para-nitrobenzyl esterase
VSDFTTAGTEEEIVRTVEVQEQKMEKREDEMNTFKRVLLVSGMLGVGVSTGGAFAQSNPRMVDGGQVVGGPGRDPQVLVFKGIPYAAPPVEELRWRPPQPVKPWKGVKAAHDLGPACIGRNFGSIPASGMSEDCLYLNVWTPTTETGARLPVLVWIHGGGFQGGSGYHPSYDGETLAQQGVVVVTFNYRVGIFGFLAHPDLTKEAEPQASGNYGFLDQIAALHWVQRNIEKFGGDPTKVTIAGESAGSYSVSALTASAMARGLFRAAIAESGGYLVPKRDAMRSLVASEKIGSDFAQSVGADNIGLLRAMSADNLMKAVEQMPDFFAFQPGIDGAFLTEPVYLTYSKHQQAKIPLLIGSNTDEGAFLLPPKRSSLMELKARIDQTFGANSSLVRRAYPTDKWAELLRSELNLYADDGFNYPMWKWAELHRQAGQPVYYYLFGRVLPSLPGQTYKGIPREQIGAFHGDEVPYAFGNLDLVIGALDGAPRKGRWESIDHTLSQTMLKYWANFVKTGNPNGTDLPKWPRYESSIGNPLMRFNDRVEVRPDDRTARMRLLDSGFQPRLQSVRPHRELHVRQATQ